MPRIGFVRRRRQCSLDCTESNSGSWECCFCGLELNSSRGEIWGFPATDCSFDSSLHFQRFHLKPSKGVYKFWNKTIKNKLTADVEATKREKTRTEFIDKVLIMMNCDGNCEAIYSRLKQHFSIDIEFL